MATSVLDSTTTYILVRMYVCTVRPGNYATVFVSRKTGAATTTLKDKKEEEEKGMRQQRLCVCVILKRSFPDAYMKTQFVR